MLGAAVYAVKILNVFLLLQMGGFAQRWGVSPQLAGETLIEPKLRLSPLGFLLRVEWEVRALEARGKGR